LTSKNSPPILTIVENHALSNVYRVQRCNIKVYFWGTRGSLSVSLNAKQVRDKVVAALKAALRNSFSGDADVERFIDDRLPFSVRGGYGGNTSCIEIRGGDDTILCDAGTGLRDYGNHIMRSGGGGPAVYHIFLSHLHWDHIQGFPFFVPAFIPGNRINIYGFHPELETAFRNQQNPPSFPVPLDYMKAEKSFTVLDPDKEYRIGGFTVRGIKQNHPGDSYGYSFEKEGRKIVYSTDSEHKGDVRGAEHPVLDFFRDADLLIFDAQYSFIESVYTKESWGHSSNILGVELSVAAGVKRLCLFHNEPACDDEALDLFLENTRNYLQIHSDASSLRIDLAYDGLEIDI
jgi:phosphoribosyl 1,2-cyclic phosphodiesterase